MKHIQTIVGLGLVVAVTAPALAKVPLEVATPNRASCGQAVTISVTTDPKAKCKIEAQGAGVMQATKLMDQTADRFGKAQWSFDIPKNYKFDVMPVTVTVDKRGDKSRAMRSITILK